jgi:hypothetical protein
MDADRCGKSGGSWAPSAEKDFGNFCRIIFYINTNLLKILITERSQLPEEESPSAQNDHN